MRSQLPRLLLGTQHLKRTAATVSAAFRLLLDYAVIGLWPAVDGNVITQIPSILATATAAPKIELSGAISNLTAPLLAPDSTQSSSRYS